MLIEAQLSVWHAPCSIGGYCYYYYEQHAHRTSADINHLMGTRSHQLDACGSITFFILQLMTTLQISLALKILAAMHCVFHHLPPNNNSVGREIKEAKLFAVEGLHSSAEPCMY